ncbi:hypothetical protein NPIL_677971 [Nephila pilipes]|uniref:Uncharacterized protein n=1 Tax=Nephila pilipes TaxID=299642 RepID=A0A8X6PGD5_NEPPI|nr:hypothetical protein NPIL_677971 [Nephila pilipes]
MEMVGNPFKKTKRALSNKCIYFPAVIRRLKDLTEILNIWKYLITYCIIESIIKDTSSFICSGKLSYYRTKNARDTNGAEIEAILDLHYLAGVYHRNRVNLEEL